MNICAYILTNLKFKVKNKPIVERVRIIELEFFSKHVVPVSQKISLISLSTLYCSVKKENKIFHTISSMEVTKE